MQFIQTLFDTSGFPARWYCGSWTTVHGVVHITSDILIGLAYFTIPGLLVYFISKRNDVPFLRIFGLFSAFILFCGCCHFAEAVIFWHPWYRVSGLLKAVTAVVSWATVIALIPTLPRALALPRLAVVNDRLEHEIQEHQKTEVQLREMTRDLQQRNEDLDQFAYIASHDLRTPLSNIRWIADWIKSDCKELLPEKSLGHLLAMEQRIDRMEQLLDDLLDYSRVGRMDGEVVEVDVEQLLRDIGTMLAIPESFQLVTDWEVRSFSTRETPLSLVIRNLIDNALKHHDRDSGRITIRNRVLGDWLEFVVADDGPGIEPQYQQQVFKIFEKLRPVDEVEGSGMGLSIIKKTVEHYGGMISLSSSGRGAEFRFTWPLHS